MTHALVEIWELTTQFGNSVSKVSARSLGHFERRTFAKIMLEDYTGPADWLLVESMQWFLSESSVGKLAGSSRRRIPGLRQGKTFMLFHTLSCRVNGLLYSLALTGSYCPPCSLKANPTTPTPPTWIGCLDNPVLARGWKSNSQKRAGQPRSPGTVRSHLVTEWSRDQSSLSWVWRKATSGREWACKSLAQVLVVGWEGRKEGLRWEKEVYTCSFIIWKL